MKGCLILLLAFVSLAAACSNQADLGLKLNNKPHRNVERGAKASLRAEDKPLTYLESGAVYQIYPRSFQDSDGDGVGDLKGITSRLEHFVALGTNIIWLSPIFKSPMADFGYDISDFIAIDPIFGTMQDFTQLTAKAKSLGLKIVLDMVPNHSSDEHDWFIKSINRVAPYTDYYVWRDGSPNVPPTNWISVFGGPAWTYNEKRGQWYLHQFVAKQPDLNFQNPLVHEELKNTLRFWLDRGVSGFRVDAVPHLYEDPTFPDEPLSGDPNARPQDYGYLNHDGITWNREETYFVMAEMRQVLQEYEDADGEHRIMLTEAYVPLPSVIKYYGNETFRIADFPFNFALINGLGTCRPGTCTDTLDNSVSAKGNPFNGTQLHDIIVAFLGAVPAWAGQQSANWVLGNHDQSRMANRFGRGLIDGLLMVQFLLPGTPVTYYGEEIGMEDTFISWEDTQDPQGCQAGIDKFNETSRDPGRTPMQWDTSFNAGFSTSPTTWLPMGSNSATVNVQTEKENLISHFNIYRTLMALRKETSILYGDIEFPIVDEDRFSFTRIRQGATSYACLLNTGSAELRFNLSSAQGVPAQATVVVRSIQATSAETQIGFRISTTNIPVGPGEGLVLSFTGI